MPTWLKMLLGLVVLPLGLFAIIRMIVKKRRARKKKLRSLAKARRARKGKMKVVYRKSATVKSGKKLSGAQKAAFLARMNAGKRKKKKAS